MVAASGARVYAVRVQVLARLRIAFFACFLASATACSLLVDLSGLAEKAEARDSGLEAASDATLSVDAGADVEVPDVLQRTRRGLMALYVFDEDGGKVIHDTSDAAGVHLNIDYAPPPLGDGGVGEAATSGPSVTWQQPGMRVVGRVLAASAAPATSIAAECARSNALTVEAWVAPLDGQQGGPARIVTMSDTGNVQVRNFTLGQSGANYIFRLRTAGVVAEYRTDGGAGPRLTHVVATASAGGALTLWIDGAPSTFALPPGAFDFQPFRLAMANEIAGFESERLWRGDYRLVAIYCTALSATEVARNRAVGPPR